MLIKSPNSANTYRPIPLADSILENGQVVEGEWRKIKVTDSFYPLQIPRGGHNATTTAKSVRESFKDHFVNEGAVEWQWKYC